MAEHEYLLNEAQCFYLCMAALTDKEAKAAGDICSDMIKVIMAWRRGKLLPRWEVPALAELCKDFATSDCSSSTSRNVMACRIRSLRHRRRRILKSATR